ncbi:hypothetical protein [Burkholderia ubonensis]|uniref:hypothetical protein n=1 Tax=Burkholderia ubonensis TaxID=101571 RepID=UPI0012FA048A|nr:hypothetical protein [Burkholderia ubonensis]
MSVQAPVPVRTALAAILFVLKTGMHRRHPDQTITPIEDVAKSARASAGGQAHEKHA